MNDITIKPTHVLSVENATYELFYWVECALAGEEVFIRDRRQRLVKLVPMLVTPDAAGLGPRGSSVDAA